MNVVDVVALKWLDAEHKLLGGTVVTSEFGAVPLCIHENYDVEYGRQLWTDAIAGKYGPIFDYVAPPELTPDEKRALMPNLSARQLRLGLLHLGKLNDVPVAIGALPEPEKSQAQIEWDYASEFRRLHPLIVQLIPILGLTDEQVDPVWEQFSQV